MQSFKEYLLKEDLDNFEFWPRKDVLDWVTQNGHRVLKKYNIKDFINGSLKGAWPALDGVVVAEYVTLTDHSDSLPKIAGTNYTYLPCQFGEIYGNFFISNCNLGSLKGSPKKVHKKYSISNNYAITSIQYLPEEAGSYILRNTGIKSFSGIHKVIKKVTSTTEATIMLPSSTNHALLGFLKIPGLKELKLSQVVQDHGKSVSKELISAVNIVNKHLAANKDIMECQEELIDTGLKDFAEL